MNHRDASQIVFGLIVENRKSHTSFLPDDFAEPFDEAVQFMHENPEWSKEDLVKIIAPSFIQEAQYAVKALNGMGDTTDWATIMRDYAEDIRLSKVYKKAATDLERGKPVDFLSLSGHTQARVLKDKHGPTLLSEIDCNDYEPFIASGDEVIDNIIGGIPADGPIIVYGLTGVGKSHWLASHMAKFLKHHKEKKGIVYTLEMGAKHWKWRETQMYPYLEDVKDRFLVSGDVRSVEDLVAEVSAGQYDIVGIDDLDGLARENSAAEFERLYKRIKEVCRFMKIPVFVLAQPNRTAKLSNKFLGRYDVAWSGAAENSAALLIALQRTNELDLGEDSHPFPVFDEDHEYMIFWKSRDGWPGDYPDKYPKGQFGPGAVILKPGNMLWEGEPLGKKYGFDDNGNPIVESHGTLWRSYSKVVMKPKKKKKSYTE